MKLNRYSPQEVKIYLASLLRKTIKSRESRDEIMNATQLLVERVEQKGALSLEELGKLVCFFIPESCDDCVWLSYEARASCPSQNGAPCRTYLNKVFSYLEGRGLI